MPEGPGGGALRASIEFPTAVWQEEVGRLDRRSKARIEAEGARGQIEARPMGLPWRPCEADAPGGTRLPGCRKLYVPLGKAGASEAPYGFVFRVIRRTDGALAWSMLAFGARHPRDRHTRSVYERAHKRLHGHFPDQASRAR